MSKFSIYFINNDEDTLQKLELLGFHICTCCRFKNTKWIHFYYRESNKNKEFHGTGYACENECPDNCSEKCITCAIKSCIEYKHNVYIFSDIDEMIKMIDSLYKDA